MRFTRLVSCVVAPDTVMNPAKHHAERISVFSALQYFHMKLGF